MERKVDSVNIVSKIINENGKRIVVYHPIVDGRELPMYSENPDVALLAGLGYKYDNGLSSDFTKYACRMLGINSKWAE